MARRLIDETIQEAIMAEKFTGKTCKEIAAEFDVSDSYVSKVCRGSAQWQVWFATQWANIYPGDAARKTKKFKKGDAIWP